MAFENWNGLIRQCEKQAASKEAKEKNSGTETEHIEAKARY